MRPSVAFLLIPFLAGCSSDKPVRKEEAPAQPPMKEAVKETPRKEAPVAKPKPEEEKKPEAKKENVMASGLKVEDLVVGDGPAAKAGDNLEMHYTGWLMNGTKFDSSLDRGQPFAFQLGAGQVIKGWDEGVAGMKVGGKRILIIPPALGYGARGAGGVIPPNATLKFEVQLVRIR